jgi:phosphoribosylformylglycinamidine synthase
MLLIVKKGCEEKVKALLDRWEIRSDIIGRVTNTGLAVVKEGGKVVAEIPVNLLVSPPLYRQRSKKPAWLEELQSLDMSIVPDLKPRQCNSVLLRLLASPNIASRECIYRQCDYQAMGNTVVPPGGDAAVLRIKGTKKGISLTVDGNGRYCYVDPFVGGVIAVAEAARNLVCNGAEPLAITDCLNFGNPEKADVYYQLKECIKGMTRACRELKVPVISGNVSLYNESKGEAIYPTPVVGMLGIVEDISRHCTMSFKKEGDLVFLLGESSPLTSSSQLSSYNGIGASEYLELVHGLVRGKPGIDLDMEKRVQRCCLEAIKRGVIKSAHDCSEGGLLVAIVESCICGDIGFKGENWKVKGRLDSAFFGEQQSRVVVSMSSNSAVKLSKVARKWQVPLTLLGRVGGKRLVVAGYIDLPLAKVASTWRDGLKR